MDNIGRQTLGDYRFGKKIAGSKNRLKDLVDRDVFHILEKYENAMVMESLVDASKAKNFDTILGLTRLLPNGKSWLELDKDAIEALVVAIMNKYSDSGKENSVTADFKRFLKIWFRFIKFQSRSFKKVGDPLETRDIVTRTVETKVTRLQLISPQEKKKLLDACTHLRDKALIDTHYDAGTRIGEILSIQIKHVKKVPNVKAYELSVDGKTGARRIIVAECVQSLVQWLENHPEKTNPEAYLFPNMKHVWKGNKLSYAGSVRVLNRVCKDAGIRHLYWHLFRHTEATRSAKTMTESLLKQRHGWSATSKMSARYAHVSNQDANNAYLKAHGLPTDESQEASTLPLICKVCHTENSYGTTICMDCGQPLTTEMARIIVTKDSQFDKKALIAEFMPEMARVFIESLGLTKKQTKSDIAKMSQKEKDKLLEKLLS